ncbi:MAG: conserved membrane protein of unknown function [Promethearchaeota archaeon]|nr:MAG: conserved membrane protein of unknown function [Candidatus Lokiarchaeota archaeon]
MVEDKELKRGLSLGMTIFIIIGIVIGSSIWVSPAAYLNRTGPAVFLAYMIAVIPAIFVAYICAYLGSALPVAGGTYVLNSRISGKFLGFMTTWLLILAVGAALAFLGSAFGLFLAEIFLIPADFQLIFVIIIGILVLVAFFFLNLIHIEISGLIEMIITIVGDVAVMIIFIIAAIPHFNAANLDPLFPPEIGFGPVLTASLTFFFSYVGFTLVLDIAGEVKNPRKYIPLALIISIPTLMILYTVQSLMVAGLQPWDQPVETVTQIILNSGILPSGVVIVITVLIAIAIASTIHPTFLAYSRDILMAGRDELFPKKFAKVHEKYKTPVSALMVLLAVGIIFLLIFIPLLGPEIGIGTTGVLLSAVTAVCVLIIQIPICISAILLNKKYPDLHENAGFKPSNRNIKIMGVIGAIISFVFVLLLFFDPDAGLIVSLVVFPYLGIGVIVYLVRVFMLKRKGIDIEERLKDFPEEVSFEEEPPISKVEKLAREKKERES